MAMIDSVMGSCPLLKQGPDLTQLLPQRGDLLLEFRQTIVVRTGETDFIYVGRRCSDGQADMNEDLGHQ